MLDVLESQKAGADAQVSGEDEAPAHGEEKAAQEEIPFQLYEMIKDGDVGTLLPATDDAVMQLHSLVLEGSNPTASYLNDEQERNNEQAFMAQNSDEEEAEEEEEPASLTEFKDLASERSGLLAQMKVLDAMLRQVEAEEQKRAVLEGPVVGVSATGISLSYPNVGDGGSCKRQRRPNPKYFDSEIDADFLAPGSSPLVGFGSYGEDFSDALGFSDGRSLQSAGYGMSKNIARATLSFFDRCSVRSAGTHRTRTALAQKPRVFFNPESPTGATGALESENHLDNLSIRELHEAYRLKFGRDTSVKDKHWLKRQIFMGSSKLNGSSVGKENSRGNPPLPETNVKARLEKDSSAEVPLSAFGSIVANGGTKRGLGSPGPSPDSKRPHRKTISLAVLSPSGVVNLSTAGECGENPGGTNNIVNSIEVQNTEIPVGGKRLRKPNRRYIEDEGDGSLSNGGRSILSTYLSTGNALRPGSLRLSWRRDAEVVGHGSRNSALRSTGIRASTRGNSYHGRWTKHGTNGVKRKNEGRAAKLVKMAHSARAAQHDVKGTMRKVKFRLPAAPGQDKGELLNGGDGEQVSCLLPVLTDESSEDYQILGSHYLSRLEDSGEQAVVTVPTANGGTRRKHHRPWTLREVVTLVEGVSRCGGGKWADIKKLAFSTVGYRTAVDLKDKWRNLLRASRAQLHPLKQGETRKKQFSASIPGHILARVRELAALNNQILPSTNTGSSTSRSGRTVHRR